MDVKTGVLMLADISGYTDYLGGVELEHCHDVLAKLLAVVSEQMSALRVTKFEGDAVLCYDPRDDCNAEVLVATIEACYFAFAQLRRQVELNRTCPCAACTRVPSLELKLIAHHGSFVEERIGGSLELVGSDVVLAHRLLKNSVTRRSGLHAYALITDACVRGLGLDPVGLGLTGHEQRCSGFGQVACWVRDLEARWREEQERTAVVVMPEESFGTFQRDVPVPPAVAWEWLTSPDKKVLWRIFDKRIHAPDRQRTRGVGAVTHCVMQPPLGTSVERCLDWKPYRYFTCSQEGRFAAFVYTTELELLEDGTGTRLTSRFRPLGRHGRLTYRLFGGRLRAGLEQSHDKLATLLAGQATQ
jgi:class 3 adenylate cyclase